MAKLAKCPKCKGVELGIQEVWEGHTIGYLQTELEGLIKTGNEVGYCVKVVGNCFDCDHRWTFRGATSMRDVADRLGVELDEVVF